MKKILLTSLLATAASSALAADQTHYDLIRPVYPMTWSTTDAIEGGTVLGFSKFEKGTDETIRNPLPAVGASPKEFEANGIISDTLDQAYIDALNLSVGNIHVNQAGYLPDDQEQMFHYMSESGECSETYSVVDTDGKTVAEGGTFTATENKAGFKRTVKAYEIASKTRYTASVSGEEKTVCVGKLADMAGLPTNKRLRIKVGQEYSSTFIISDEVYSMVRDAGLKFFGAQRSGDSESWFHGPSHMNDGDGALQGGWYDAGDHLKNGITMSYTFMVLSTMAATNPEHDDDHYAYNHNEVETTDKIPDALREAKHGADYFLRSYVHAKGVIDDMAVSVGNITEDHNSWNRADGEDTRTVKREAHLGHLGSNVSSNIAAGLALLGKDYAKYDKPFADSCLMVAKKLYDFARALRLKENSYDGGKPFVNNTMAGGWSADELGYPSGKDVDDKLAMAAVALLYATDGKDKDFDYLDDLVHNSKINNNAKYAEYTPESNFEGGWFGNSSGFGPGGWVSDYAYTHIFSLYAFYKLILADEKTSESFGIDKYTRLDYIEKVIFILLKDNVQNLGENTDTHKISLATINGVEKSINANGLTFSLWDKYFEDVTNYYEIGAQLTLLMFADIAKDLTKNEILLPHNYNVTWNYKEAKQNVISRMNYLLGMNRWDMSMVVGVGDKNESHVKHPTSNPEGYNKYEFMDPPVEFYPDYKYRPLVGDLMGGFTSSIDSLYSDIYKTYVDLHGNAKLQAVLMLLSKERSPATVDTSAKDTSITDSTEAIPQTPAFSKSLNVAKHGSILEVNYSLSQAATAEIQLVSVQGKTVRKFNERQSAGSHTALFDLSSLPAGAYIVKAKAGSLSATKLIQLTK